MKKVKGKSLLRNKEFYFTILEHLKQGLNPSQISKKFKIKKQNLNYYLRGLKMNGIITKKGYGIWEVKDIPLNTLTLLPLKQIRSHAFIWTIKLKKQTDWKSKLKIDYKLIRNIIPRIIINNRKIWLGKNTITIYEPHSFYGTTGFNARKYAVISLIEILTKLESKLNINLKPYTFRPAREHYGQIKNDLAQQCNRQGEKIRVKDDIDGEWLWIDDSLSLGELETNNPLISYKVQKWFNDHKKHNFEVTPTFLLESMNQITQNQATFNKNIVKHQKVLDEMLLTLKKLQKSL